MVEIHGLYNLRNRFDETADELLKIFADVHEGALNVVFEVVS